MKDNLSLDETVTTEQAAKILGCKPKTLKNMRAKSEGPDYMKIGRLVRYRIRALYRYMDQNTVRVA